jgi:mono/diheme cytochrome c family protein
MRIGLPLFGFLLSELVLLSSGAIAASPASRGESLANHVAMCVQCHSPRDAQGGLDRTRLFKGAPIPLRSPFPAQNWALTAPSIAGLPGWMAEDAMALLTTGRRLSGYAPKPPMPPFRLSPEDAEAVIVYLRSLP